MSRANIDQALALVVEKFRGMTDQDGEPYVMHCLRVMMGVADSDAQLVGLMHDLVEDTDVTLEQLEEIGFAPEVVEALRLITHDKKEPYADYVVRLSTNPMAREAKLSDLRDNGAMGRVLYRPSQLQSDMKRIQRYVLSYQFLTQQIAESEYRSQMNRVEQS